MKHVPKFAGFFEPVISAWCTSVVPQILVECVNPSELENFVAACDPRCKMEREGSFAFLNLR